MGKWETTTATASISTAGRAKTGKRDPTHICSTGNLHQQDDYPHAAAADKDVVVARAGISDIRAGNPGIRPEGAYTIYITATEIRRRNRGPDESWKEQLEFLES